MAECARVAAALARRYPDCRVIDEHELRREELIEGAPLASATLGYGHGGERRLHRPDLVIWPPDGDARLPVAVEVELTPKAPGRLSDICRAWARCAETGGVVYLAAPEALGGLRRVVAREGVEERVIVLPLAVLADDVGAPRDRRGRAQPSTGAPDSRAAPIVGPPKSTVPSTA